MRSGTEAEHFGAVAREPGGELVPLPAPCLRFGGFGRKGFSISGLEVQRYTRLGRFHFQGKACCFPEKTCLEVQRSTSSGFCMNKTWLSLKSMCRGSKVHEFRV